MKHTHLITDAIQIQGNTNTHWQLSSHYRRRRIVSGILIVFTWQTFSQAGVVNNMECETKKMRLRENFLRCGFVWEKWKRTRGATYLACVETGDGGILTILLTIRLPTAHCGTPTPPTLPPNPPIFWATKRLHYKAMQLAIVRPTPTT